MNTSTVEKPDTTESIAFLTAWCALSHAPHVTLTAITPDGPTTTATFGAAETDAAVAAWITKHQAAGRNIYFQVNETPARCSKKPSKNTMIAALCRHADIDPCDPEHPYAAERDRLRKLAESLNADPDLRPTFILDSGNGVQPLWVVTREVLTPDVIARIETENAAIEAAVGAGGTHNVDRLLRLPGTLNFPNAKKQRAGRGIGRARLLHAGGAAYAAEEAATLGTRLAERLAGSPLVRAHKPATDTEKKPAKSGTTDRSRAAFKIGAEIRRAGSTFDDMVRGIYADPDTAS